MTQPAAACPNCGAPAKADQLFCLECGERIHLGYRRPPSWRLPAAILAFVLLLAGGALAVALIEISDEAGEVAQAPGPNAPPPAATQEQDDRTSERTETEEAPAPAEEAPASGEIAQWPDDTSAYTVILLSTNTRDGAEAVARQAARAGIPAGVLQSDDYSSLNPGFWVVFGGEFDSSEEAQREAESYAGLGFPGGYPRFVNGAGGSG